MRRVVVFGVFDIFHPGHLYFLAQARQHGDHLTVVVTRDKRVQSEKGRKPILNERERLVVVQAVKWVDQAILGDKAGEHKVLKRLKPDVVCVGYDQKKWMVGVTRKYVPQVVYIKSLRAEQYNSTRFKAKYAGH